MDVGQVVLVRWIDACGFEDWHFIDDSHYGLVEIDTVGFVTTVEDTYVTLMSSVDSVREVAGSGISIPRCCITHVEILKE